MALPGGVEYPVRPHGNRLLSRCHAKGEDTKALTLYAVQLIFNFFWSIWFFNLGWYLFAFLWLVALWILIIATTVAFYRISKPAAWLMLPYLVWVALAGYLNLGVWWLSR